MKSTKDLSAKLIVSEERYRRLFETAQDGILILDMRTGLIIDANPFMCKLTGYSMKGFLDKHLWDLGFIKNIVENKEKFLELQDKGYVRYENLPIKTKSGEIRYVEFISNSYLVGKQTVIQCNIRDISERVENLKLAEQLNHSLNNTIVAIASMVEQRDPYTAGHQRRVAELAEAIAKDMGISSKEIIGIRMAAVVHDIGKIHIPAEILSKPTTLSDAEVEIIRTHPKVGWDVLKHIDFPWPVAEMVYQHHERLDGSGYPRGLKGDDILLGARILMVADVVDAMSEFRPYRPAKGIFVALQEIMKQKGVLYDKDVVNACIRLFLEKNYDLCIYNNLSS